MSEFIAEPELARHFDLKNLPADFYENPFRYYRALREHQPAKRLPDGSWLFTRYADVAAVYREGQAADAEGDRGLRAA